MRRSGNRFRCSTAPGLAPRDSDAISWPAASEHDGSPRAQARPGDRDVRHAVASERPGRTCRHDEPQAARWEALIPMAEAAELLVFSSRTDAPAGGRRALSAVGEGADRLLAGVPADAHSATPGRIGIRYAQRPRQRVAVACARSGVSSSPEALRTALSQEVARVSLGPNGAAGLVGAPDVLGDVYERLLPPEQRRAAGQFWTPAWAADVMSGWLRVEPMRTLLDPAVGTGSLLYRTAASATDCPTLIGVDSDSLGV
jgi:hypothetical protein